MYNNFMGDLTTRIGASISAAAETAENYWAGKHKENLRRKDGQYNDNVTINLFGLVIDRNVSQMISGGVNLEVEGEDGDTALPEGDFLRGCLDANHEEIFFHRSCLAAGMNGTGYWFLLDPQSSFVVGEDGKQYPRILVWNPGLVTMKTQHGDYEVVIQYTHQYYEMDEDGRQVGYRKVVARDMSAVAERWTIQDWIERTGRGWVAVAPAVVWRWPFSPVLHWQNLPSVANCYGEPDLTDDKLVLQNAINADASVIRKNIRLLSNPRIWSKGPNKPESIDAGPDKLIHMGENGEMHVEPALGDLVAAREFVNWEKAVFMDGARTVDIHSLADKLGSLTNFALRVLYQDNVNKIDTKRELMGDAIEDLARRLQIMVGLTPVPVSVKWEDFVPVNSMEQAQTEQVIVGMGAESVQTASENLGRDWQQELDRMAEEKQSSDNIGAFLLNAFNKNGGVDNANTPPMGNNMQQGGMNAYNQTAPTGG
jgi:hypothetical protein